MADLHIFNPDTDYALGCNRDYYTAPRSVLKLRRENALLPALYARHGDYILLLDSPLCDLSQLRFYKVACSKQLKIVCLEECGNLREELILHNPRPWGWNRNIHRLLIDNIGEFEGLPTIEKINKIRELSHRRTSIRILEEMEEILDEEIVKPKEIFNVEEAIDCYLKDRELFFKAPWSSSGRGILYAGDLEYKHVEPWVRGIINHQGSVMMEKAYTRNLDFATEWWISNKKVDFLGFSVFKTSKRGKYHCNIEGSQRDLVNLIKQTSANFDHKILEKQKESIEKVILPDYSGPLGIDMLITTTGKINPCVEINLRHTMGMIGLL